MKAVDQITGWTVYVFPNLSILPRPSKPGLATATLFKTNLYDFKLFNLELFNTDQGKLKKLSSIFSRKPSALSTLRQTKKNEPNLPP